MVRHRDALPFVIGWGIWLMAGQAVLADEPSPPSASLVPKVKVGKVLQLPADVEIPVESETESKESSVETQQMIRDALDGKDVTAGGALGDVLQALRSQGSVLKGTSLDKQAASDSDSELNRPLDPGQLELPPLDSRAIAAESLLRSARLLHQTMSREHGKADESARAKNEMTENRRKRFALIQRMQQEAFFLLEELVLPQETIQR